MINPGYKARSAIVVLASVLLLIIVAPLPGLAGMDVMTNHELGEMEGGKLVELAISDNNYYASTTPVTVVRFASDIYQEVYGEIGALKMGDYSRSASELGDLVSMDSNYTMVYGPNNRANPGSGGIGGTYKGTGTDSPYMSANTNRTDRIHDQYQGTGSSSVTLGTATNMNGTAPPNYFGSYRCTHYPETQWDINWENLQFGVNAQYPLRMYGLVLRAEFDHWGTSRQQLRRFVIGSNNVYGYSSSRPLVTSGWLNSEMARLSNQVQAVGINDVAFQVQRDPVMDEYWSLSSFNFNPDNPNDAGSFRQFWFNTQMTDVTANPSPYTNLIGAYQDKNHGFFLMIDMTDKRFSGWNLIAGVNEYRDWPPLEQDDDHYFESEYRSD